MTKYLAAFYSSSFGFRISSFHTMLLPCLLTMTVLLLGSAFFSASEAAMFSLRKAQRRELSKGSRAEQITARLLNDPDRLLTAVLFWNLLVNLSFFTIGSILSLQMQQAGHATAAWVFAAGSLVTIITFGEMLPKSLGVLQPQRLAVWLAIPLAVTIRIIDPLLPVFRVATLLSRRLLWPNFEPEPYLHVRDLERAVKLSGADATLVEQEERVLESIVLLSDIRAEELMRPRTQFLTYRPPVTLADLKARPPSGGYLLVTEADSEEVASAIALDDVWQTLDGPLDLLAEPVIYVPWSTRAADVLELIRRRKREVAAVVNEFGETIGILTFDDILDTLFSGAPSRSERLLRRDPIRPVAPGVWHVTGMTGVRRLARYFQIDKPATHSITLSGVIQEVLERLPELGDECSWGPFHFKILDVPLRGQLLVELTMPDAKEETS
ncbi:MAG: CNNM domain-containing protein [Planctomycetota bacterium]